MICGARVLRIVSEGGISEVEVDDSPADELASGRPEAAPNATGGTVALLGARL